MQESSAKEAHQHPCLSVYTVGIINQIHVLSSKHQVLIMDDWYFPFLALIKPREKEGAEQILKDLTISRP